MTGIIILAAGTSSRLGRPKQTLQYEDGSLLKHTIRAAVDSAIGPVFVVTGANEEEIRNDIKDEAVSIISNKGYQSGIASSIHAGLSYLRVADDNCEGVIIMVCDQPHVNSNILKCLIEAKTASKTLVACSYKNTIGVPAFFDKVYFPELLSLTGEEGGKKILIQHLDSVTTVHFPNGQIDIDTESDYEKLVN